jgi:predicted nucleic acid-binding protein
MKFFFDSNILVYVFDRSSPHKREIARGLLKDHAAKGDILMSTQVLQEFYVTVTRKLKPSLGPDEAALAVAGLADLPTVQIDNLLIQSAIRRSQASQLSFWDGLIVQAALAGGASTLYSEDLQDGQVFDCLKVKNPFKPG